MSRKKSDSLREEEVRVTQVFLDLARMEKNQKQKTNQLKSNTIGIVIGKKINHSAPGSQIFADLQPHFPRFVCILHTNLGKWSFP